MRARDIMEPVKDVLSPDNTLKEAVNRMRIIRRGTSGMGVKGMMVLDDEGRLLGMVSIKDILKAIIPNYMTMTNLGEFTWDGMLEEMCKKVENKKVSEIMTSDVLTVDEEAPLMEVADLIVKQNLQRVPVTGKDGKPVGIIYVRDLYYAIVKALLEES
jgi:CBS domain-containing protein